ncbi:hypothetical protein GQ600_3920 [Phytophthora cactorum]|nr:hypothetical protein GQ600_3920 [Phytophthora cactorum]
MCHAEASWRRTQRGGRAAGSNGVEVQDQDETLFNVYFASLDTLYAKLDEVFEEAGILDARVDKVLGEEPTRKMDGETHYLENVGVTRVPFNYQRTCDAVWELLSAQHRQDERYDYHGLPDAENAKALQYCSSLRHENGGCSVRRRLHSSHAMSHYQYGGNEQRGKLDQFMELSVKTVAEDNLEIEYMMERLLLDDALSTDGLVIDEEGNLALAES